MNSVLFTIIAAIEDLDDKNVKREYDSLLYALKQKFGTENNLIRAIELVEKMSDSVARREVLKEELEANKIEQDEHITKITQTLLNYVNSRKPSAKGGKSAPLDYSIIRKLRFGKDSAEKDREFIEKAFLYTPFYQRIQRGEKHLVIGRKGAGKTATCLKLYDYLDKQGAKVSLITPRDLSKFVVSMLEKASINALESQLLAWKQVFLVELGLYILEEAGKVYGPNYLIWPEPVRHIRQFIADNVSGKANWIDKTFKIIRTVRKLGIKVAMVEVSTEATSAEARDFVGELDKMVDCITKVAGSLIITPIYIFVDKVDELWDPTPESKALIIGLLRAAQEIDEQLKSADVIVFLRSDIYKTLQFDDSDKFHGSEEQITWKKDDLKKMVALRAISSTGIGIKQDAYNQIWQTFFPSEIEGKDSFEYLLQHTLMRPRDLIQLCNLCRDKAQDNGHQKIEVSDIFEALPQYSEWKLQDLRDEYRIQYPFLEYIFLSIFYRCLSILTKDSIIQSFEDIEEKLIKQFSDYYFNPIENLLQVLYNIGFLGVVTKNGVQYTFLEGKAIIADASKFEVNPVFRSVLEIEPFDLQEKKIGVSGNEKQNIHVGGHTSVGQNINIGGTITGIQQSIIAGEGSTVNMSIYPDKRKLRLAILKAYTLTEFRILAAKMNVDTEILGGNTLEIKVLELINYCDRRGRYKELVKQVIKDRPFLADHLSLE